MHFMDLLHNDYIVHIIKFLNQVDLYSLLQTCKTAYNTNLIKDNLQKSKIFLHKQCNKILLQDPATILKLLFKPVPIMLAIKANHYIRVSTYDALLDYLKDNRIKIGEIFNINSYYYELNNDRIDSKYLNYSDPNYEDTYFVKITKNFISSPKSPRSIYTYFKIIKTDSEYTFNFIILNPIEHPPYYADLLGQLPYYNLKTDMLIENTIYTNDSYDYDYFMEFNIKNCISKIIYFINYNNDVNNTKSIKLLKARSPFCIAQPNLKI